MALSNLKNEPRREITEQLVGLVSIGAFLTIDYFAASWALGKYANDWGLVFIMMMLGLFVAFFGVLFLTFFVHFFGEGVCNALAAVGFDPRPKQRYRR